MALGRLPLLTAGGGGGGLLFGAAALFCHVGSHTMLVTLRSGAARQVEGSILGQHCTAVGRACSYKGRPLRGGLYFGWSENCCLIDLLQTDCSHAPVKLLSRLLHCSGPVFWQQAGRTELSCCAAVGALLHGLGGFAWLHCYCSSAPTMCCIATGNVLASLLAFSQPWLACYVP